MVTDGLSGNGSFYAAVLNNNIDISLSAGDVNFCASVSKLAKIKAITGPFLSVF